ncbi:hypothetical protein [Streptacidiphilus sp. P02-A3a]|uniref:hypothetical protein n=1 Tax=Streptacidiphilus sp. P02-A3a TaxID=2704468 RepID=UPI0015FC9938|nr:hypothetical protein [Streptacidiphilus sp. P02-A3a]QMU68400.1 hypothetical protein GXP74_09350 [Streptacidiphilus sp. P02-A3a]
MTTLPPPPPAPDVQDVPAVPPPPPAPDGPAAPDAAVWAVPETDPREWGLRLLGVPLALAVTDPAGWFSGPPARLLLPLVAVLGALAGAGPVAARPVLGDGRWRRRIVRYRNSLFTAGCVLFAALFPPPGWLAVCDTVLLLSYLLLLDAFVGGPPAAALLRRPLALLSLYAGSGVVLAAALLPVDATGAWARLIAALAIAGSGAGVLAALRLRHRGPRPTGGR